MSREFVSYAFQDLSRKKIKKYAAQYDDIDMAALLGADENNFPFLIRNELSRHDDSADTYSVMVWNTYNGIMEHVDEDSVRAYATELYLREHAYPTFASFSEAEQWAADHNWPRKPHS